MKGGGSGNKGISPLLATVLLIASTVAITTMLSGWVSTTMGTTQNTVTNKTTEGVSCAAAEIVIDDVYAGAGSGGIARAIVRNSGGSDNLAITSAQLYDKFGNNFTTVNSLPTSLNKGQMATLSFNYTILPATTNDSAQGFNNGTLMNGAAYTLNGKYGGGLRFDGGNDYVNANNATILNTPNLANKITLEVWLKPSATFDSTADYYQGILDKGSYRLFLDKSDGKMKLSIDSNTSDTWSWVGNLTNATYIQSLKVFKGKIYAMDDDNGKIYASLNGSNWTEVGTVGYTGNRASAVFSNKIYFGSGSYVYYSSNGTSWDSAQVDSSIALMDDIVPFNGRLYAGSELQGKIYSSADGTSWTEVLDSNDNSIRAMTVFNGKIYAASGWTLGKIYSSSNGVTWTEEVDIANMTNPLTMAVFNDKLYLGHYNNGTIFSSSDGSNWSMVGYIGEVSTWSLAVFNGKLYAGTGGGGKIYSSFDGENWTEVYDSIQAHILSLASFEGKLYASSYQKEIYAGGDSEVLASNKTSWGPEWTHVGATYNGSVTNIYVNGILDNNKSSSLTIDTSIANLFFGATHGSQHGTYSGGSGELFGGTIDDVAIWNRSLTNAEINSSMNSGPLTVSNTNDLVGYWKFDEGKGILSCPSDFSRVVITTNCGGVSAEFSKRPKC